MERIDAHQHFWQYDPVRDDWITDEMQVLKKNFMPEQLAPVLVEAGFTGSVLVQSDQTRIGNQFMIDLASEHPFIRGIVAWVDLMADDIVEQLTYYTNYDTVKGFRHVLQGEKDRAFMLQPNFLRGIGALKDFGFTYDILIYPDQLQHIGEFVAQFPEQKFVIDHIAKPDIKHRNISDWKKEIETIAQYPNVYCKISGMVTEADWQQWRKEDFTPYMDVIMEAFGTKRILFGSDWPVCLVAASYSQVLGIVEEYFHSFTKGEQEDFFGNNAIEFYNLI